MNQKPYPRCARVPARRQRGLTMIELTVTMVIALFLLAGVLMMVQNTRTTYTSQTALAQLQDNERLAMTIMTDVIQSSGYYPDPVHNDSTVFTNDPTTGLGSTQTIVGVQSGSAPQDTLTVRYMTSSLAVGSGDGILNCLGSSNTTGHTVIYTNTFALAATADPSGNRALQCTLSDGTTTSTQTLVSGIQDMQVYYGVKRTTTINDFNVDTYVRANDMQPNDWKSISAVRVILIFANPVANGATGTTTITFERVVAVMNRAGVMT